MTAPREVDHSSAPGGTRRSRWWWLAGTPAAAVLGTVAVLTGAGWVVTVAFAALVLTTISALAALGRAIRRLAHHEPDHTERFPDLNGEGDFCLHAVCSCGASRRMGDGRLSWSPLLCRR